jgi:D-serine deaminase-like pyridoxal phosphate-dependent protein
MLELARTQKLQLRPHVKTHKTLEGADLQCGAGAAATGGSPSASRGDGAKIVVSTLAEAEHFAAGGYGDILYAVPLDPSKFPRVWSLHVSLPSFHAMVESAEGAEALESFLSAQIAAVTAEAASNAAATGAGAGSEGPSDLLLQAGRRLSVFLAVDATGYKREGVDPDDPASVDLAVSIARSRRLRFAGIYSHSGNSYNCKGPAPADSSAGETAKNASARVGAGVVAASERDVMVAFAEKIRAQGVDVPVVSLGATPSACSGIEWSPGLELHPGNYLFLDRQQIESGSGTLEDVAVYVLARVIATYPTRNEFLIDAGSCAMHKDPAGIRDATWGCLRDDPSLVLVRMTQEVAVVGRKDGTPVDFSKYAVGTPVRVLPNHACMTAACHPVFHVVDGAGGGAGGGAGAGVGGEVGVGVAGAGAGASAAASGAAWGGLPIVGKWTPCKFW